MNIRKTFLIFTLLAVTSSTCPADPIIHNGQRIAFLGDSITAFGADHPGGYPRLVVSGLEANGIKLSFPVFAGAGGNTSKDMLARLDRDVIAKKTDFMTLSCGVNDVWHGAKGVPLDQYKENITAIVDQAASNNIKVVILTATMIGEDPANTFNEKLAAYNIFLKQLAAERHLPLADLNALMQTAVKKAKADNAPHTVGANYLTLDGVHMAPPGDLIMAEGILRALGLTEAQMAKAQTVWTDMPASTRIKGVTMLSLKDYDKLAAQAAQEKLTVDQYVEKLLSQAVEKQIVH